MATNEEKIIPCVYEYTKDCSIIISHIEEIRLEFSVVEIYLISGRKILIHGDTGDTKNTKSINDYNRFCRSIKQYYSDLNNASRSINFD